MAINIVQVVHKRTRVVVNNMQDKSNIGFVALTTVLVVSAVVLFVTISISLLGVDEARSSLDYKKGQETLLIAEGCAEEALIRLRSDSSYVGTATALTVGNGNCTIVVTGTLPDKNITIQAEIPGQPIYRKRLSVDVKVAAGSVNIVSWSEI